MKTLGQIAFEAYRQKVGGLTHLGNPIPKWEELTDAVRAGWENAAVAVQSEVKKRSSAMAELLQNLIDKGGETQPK